MRFFPPNDSAFSPFVWLVDLDEGARCGCSEASNADSADRHLVDRNGSLPELGGRREMSSTQPVIPRRVTFAEAIAWSVPDSAFVAGQPTAAPSGQALRAACRILWGVAWDDLEHCAAHETPLLDFALTGHPKDNGRARPRTELAAICEPERSNPEGLCTTLALDNRHPTTIAGAGTPGLDEDCPLFAELSPPPATYDAEDQAMADLFAPLAAD